MTTERQDPVEQEALPANGHDLTPRAGQKSAGLDRLTRRLPGAEARRTRPLRSGRGGPPREQLAALVDALGDAAHPLHATAVDELAAIGPPAVPVLYDALSPQRPWLTIYRAAEAAGRIGDGRATGPLIQALSHPNSNVRWSAVRALAQIGDVRALLELRRLAQHDQGRTSWGEPVAAAAQSALNTIGRRSVWGQSIELIKTAVVAVLMIAALILAFGVVGALRAELATFGRFIPGQTELPQFILPTSSPAPTEAAALPAVVPEAPVVPTPAAEPTIEPALAPTSGVGATGVLTGTVLQEANVRPFPSADNQPIGRLFQDDEVVFLAQNSSGLWYRISLGNNRSQVAQINSRDGTGWVNGSLITEPTGPLPIEEPVPPPTLTSAPLPPTPTIDFLATPTVAP